jgi:hypothetical protein
MPSIVTDILSYDTCADWALLLCRQNLLQEAMLLPTSAIDAGSGTQSSTSGRLVRCRLQLIAAEAAQILLMQQICHPTSYLTLQLLRWHGRREHCCHCCHKSFIVAAAGLCSG